jgi:hypothetical protein
MVSLPQTLYRVPSLERYSKPDGAPRHLLTTHATALNRA